MCTVYSGGVNLESFGAPDTKNEETLKQTIGLRLCGRLCIISLEDTKPQVLNDGLSIKMSSPQYSRELRDPKFLSNRAL